MFRVLQEESGGQFPDRRSLQDIKLDGPDPRRLWDEQDSGHSKFIGLFQTLVETTMFLLPVAGIDFHRRS
jgi:hypothetical protein